MKTRILVSLIAVVGFSLSGLSVSYADEFKWGDTTVLKTHLNDHVKFPATGKVIKEPCKQEMPDEFTKDKGPTWNLKLRTTDLQNPRRGSFGHGSVTPIITVRILCSPGCSGVPGGFSGSLRGLRRRHRHETVSQLDNWTGAESNSKRSTTDSCAVRTRRRRSASPRLSMKRFATGWTPAPRTLARTRSPR